MFSAEVVRQIAVKLAAVRPTAVRPSSIVHPAFEPGLEDVDYSVSDPLYLHTVDRFPKELLGGILPAFALHIRDGGPALRGYLDRGNGYPEIHAFVGLDSCLSALSRAHNRPPRDVLQMTQEQKVARQLAANLVNFVDSEPYLVEPTTWRAVRQDLLNSNQFSNVFQTVLDWRDQLKTRFGDLYMDPFIKAISPALLQHPAVKLMIQNKVEAVGIHELIHHAIHQLYRNLLTSSDWKKIVTNRSPAYKEALLANMAKIKELIHAATSSQSIFEQALALVDLNHLIVETTLQAVPPESKRQYLHDVAIEGISEAIACGHSIHNYPRYYDMFDKKSYQQLCGKYALDPGIRFPNNPGIWSGYGRELAEKGLAFLPKMVEREFGIVEQDMGISLN